MHLIDNGYLKGKTEIKIVVRGVGGVVAGHGGGRGVLLLYILCILLNFF